MSVNFLERQVEMLKTEYGKMASEFSSFCHQFHHTESP